MFAFGLEFNVFMIRAELKILLLKMSRGNNFWKCCSRRAIFSFHTSIQFIVPTVVAISAYRPPATVGTVKSKTGEFRSAVNARRSHLAHTSAVTAPACTIRSWLSSSRFPRRLARVHKRSVFVCARSCVRVVHAYISTVVYICGGGREVTRQGFNGILFTGFVPRLGKHSVGADPSGLSSSAFSYIEPSKSIRIISEMDFLTYFKTSLPWWKDVADSITIYSSI